MNFEGVTGIFNGSSAHNGLENVLQAAKVLS
jgi:hypothetical protein